MIGLSTHTKRQAARNLLALILIFCSASAFADFADQAKEYVGYTIVAVKTVAKWVDPDTGKSEDSFEGCDYGRIIVFDGNTALVCNEYGYQYAYRPEAVILSNGSSIIMIVGDDAYDMAKYRR